MEHLRTGTSDFQLMDGNKEVRIADAAFQETYTLNGRRLNTDFTFTDEEVYDADHLFHRVFQADWALLGQWIHATPLVATRTRSPKIMQLDGIPNKHIFLTNGDVFDLTAFKVTRPEFPSDLRKIWIGFAPVTYWLLLYKPQTHVPTVRALRERIGGDDQFYALNEVGFLRRFYIREGMVLNECLQPISEEQARAFLLPSVEIWVPDHGGLRRLEV